MGRRRTRLARIEERAAHGYVVDASAGERLSFAGAVLLVKASAETTAGSFAILEEIDPLDTPLHVHEHEDELFFVIAGDHVFQVGDDEFPAGPGAVVFAPRRVPHAHRRVVPRTGRFLTMVSPPGLEGFFRELSEAESARRRRPRGVRARLEEVRHHLVVLAALRGRPPRPLTDCRSHPSAAR